MLALAGLGASLGSLDTPLIVRHVLGVSYALIVEVVVALAAVAYGYGVVGGGGRPCD